VVGALALLGLSPLLTGAHRTSRRGCETAGELSQSRCETAAVRHHRDNCSTSARPSPETTDLKLGSRGHLVKSRRLPALTRPAIEKQSVRPSVSDSRPSHTSAGLMPPTNRQPTGKRPDHRSGDQAFTCTYLVAGAGFEPVTSGL